MKTWYTLSGHRILQILSGRSNVFLLSNGEKNILIDTGSGRLWDKLEKRLTNLGINHIEYLILTHAHFDHAGNAKRIKEKFGASVIIHKNEASYLATGDNILPKGTALITRQLVKIFAKKIAPRLRYEPCQYDVLVDSNFDLKDYGFIAFILHTPGHTKGSISLIVDNEIAIVGDAMFGIFKGSVFPPYAEDAEEMVRSWRKLLETGCKFFLPSHGSANSRKLVQKDYIKRVEK